MAKHIHIHVHDAPACGCFGCKLHSGKCAEIGTVRVGVPGNAASEGLLCKECAKNVLAYTRKAGGALRAL